MQIDKFSVRDYPTIDTVGLDQGQFPIRVCIVTEEIIGPVRNGGIASTYYHLSKGLAAQGHDVHVLFLKGPVVQDETPEHWVKHFAEFGVTLHYLEVTGQPMWGAAVDWQVRFMAAYRWLRDNPPFDVVHTSEWRGGLIYALMAKRLGLAFKETLFLVKTSSPHIWNRHYQMQPIEKRDLVAAAYAEQKCVELADAVIGGSAHLITFMDEIGYHVPESNVFVQPNIVDFSKVIVTDERGPRAPGDVVKTQELIFFGRLEGRKGVELFCNALDILRERGVQPSKVTFMGKWGAQLATQGGMQVEEYIRGKANGWGFPVDYVTDKNQPEALSYMCSRDMIAVMPSLIENSTMAVYETLDNRIPFIATAVGGTPELIDPADHEQCLVAPKAQSLADRLELALRDGQVIPRSSFSNENNLTTWYGFHAHVGRLIAEQGREAAIASLVQEMDKAADPVDGIGFGVLVRRGDALDDLVAALIADRPDEAVFAYTDAMLRPMVTKAVQDLKAAGIVADQLDCIGQAAGDALNELALALTKQAMVLADGAGVRPRAGFFDATRTALAARPDCFFTTFFQADNDVLGMPIGGDVASQFLEGRAYGPEMFGFRRERYEMLGGFEPYDVRHGLMHEYITRNVERGEADLLVFPEVLVDWPNAIEEAREISNDTVYAYLKAKPLIDESSLALRKVLLASLQQQAGSMSPHLFRDGGRDEDEDVWLMPSDWDRHDVAAAGRHHLSVGLDEGQSRLWLFARGRGERILRVNNTAVPFEIAEQIGAGTGDELTLCSFDVPDTWDIAKSYAIRWEVEHEGDRARTRFFRISKMGDHLYALASRNPILTRTGIRELMEQQLDSVHLKQSLSLKDADLKFLDESGPSAAPQAKPKPTKKPKAAPTPVAQVHETGDTKAPAPSSSREIDVDATAPDEILAVAFNTNNNVLERDVLLRRSERLLADLPAAFQEVKPDAVQAALTAKLSRVWVENEWIQGWAWDRSDPKRNLTIVVKLDGEAIFATTANHVNSSLRNRSPGLERHGFRIPVLPMLLDSKNDLSIEVHETGAVLRDGVMQHGTSEDGVACLMRIARAPEETDEVKHSRAAAKDLLARFGAPADWQPKESEGSEMRAGIINPGRDIWARGDWIQGWVWDRAHPDEFFNIVVMMKGEPVFATTAKIAIPSLGIRTPGLEAHGFRIPVLPEFSEKGVALQLVVAETGGSVRNGTFGAVQAFGKAGVRVMTESERKEQEAERKEQEATPSSNGLIPTLKQYIKNIRS